MTELKTDPNYYLMLLLMLSLLMGQICWMDFVVKRFDLVQVDVLTHHWARDSCLNSRIFLYLFLRHKSITYS